jgi:general secretion pathway protein C
VAAAAALFGGRPQEAGGAQLQLRGIVFAGPASVAIIAAEGKPARALAMNAEVLPGLTVKQIAARSVLLSERGSERELSLPPFAAQEGGAAPPQAGVTPEPQPQSPSPSQPLQQPSAAPSSAGSSAAGGGAAESGAPQAPQRPAIRSGAPTMAPPSAPQTAR